jgi:hypothetical protein
LRQVDSGQNTDRTDRKSQIENERAANRRVIARSVRDPYIRRHSVTHLRAVLKRLSSTRKSCKYPPYGPCGRCGRYSVGSCVSWMALGGLGPTEMVQAFKTASTRIEVRPTAPLEEDRGHNSCYPSPSWFLSAAEGRELRRKETQPCSTPLVDPLPYFIQSSCAFFTCLPRCLRRRPKRRCSRRTGFRGPWGLTMRSSL